MVHGRPLHHAPATRAEVEDVLACVAARHPPLFLPAIYEHKASFIGRTPSAIARDADLLTRSLLAEYEAIGADALVIGVDVYNLEAEAVGCVVTYYEGNDTSIPGIKPGSHVITVGDDLSAAPLPNPGKDGRLPINLAAARNVRRTLGDDYWIRGALSAPFSLATSLVGAEELFLACLEEPEWVHRVLDYCGRITMEFAKGYIDAGVDLVLFDSQASPELLSPAMYEAFVFPITSAIVAWARRQGVEHVPLIVGGNTTRIAELLARTGANNLLCDFSADFDTWAEVCRQHRRSFRRNVSPHLIEKGPVEMIHQAAVTELERGIDVPGFIMGTGVIPFGTPTEHILAIKQACRDSAA